MEEITYHMWWKRSLPSNVDLLEDIAKLRRQIENLELEWINFYDKAKRMMGRIAKRADVVESAESKDHAEASAPVPSLGRMQAGLTPRQIEIQQQILRRRANGGA